MSRDILWVFASARIPFGDHCNHGPCPCVGDALRYSGHIVSTNHPSSVMQKCHVLNLRARVRSRPSYLLALDDCIRTDAAVFPVTGQRR
jgi:hypothetical protein